MLLLAIRTIHKANKHVTAIITIPIVSPIPPPPPFPDHPIEKLHIEAHSQEK
jgi:hypothetical protein